MIYTIKEAEEFVKYVQSFYGPTGIYKDFFNDGKGGVTRAEIYEALDTLTKIKHPWGGGDSFDREVVRDLMLKKRGHSDLEHI